MRFSQTWNTAKQTARHWMMQLKNANEAARNWITVELEEEEPLLPYVSDVEDIAVEEGDIIRNISVNIRFYEGWDE